MQSADAIVIGSGVGGLATAIRLAVMGYRVSVYEKNAAPGGKLTSFQKDGFQFDAGPSLFTQPENILELFELAGEPVADYFDFEPVEVACHYFFPNGKQVHAFTDREKFAAEMQAQTGEPASNVVRYLNDAEKLYDRIGTIFLNHSLHKRSTWLQRPIVKALLTVRYAHLFGSMNELNRKHFSKPETIQLFNRFATYNGSNPYKAPGMLTVIPHLEQNEGTFYPKGGMVSIVDALYRLAIKKGVIFHFDTPVERIIHHEGSVRGVVCNGENVMADIVVSNADIYFTYKNLLNHIPKAKRAVRTERSSSALIFYWGIGKKFEALGLHNILFSADYKAEFDQLFRKKLMSDDPTIYINITSKLDPSHAPAGKENWFVMLNAPANTGQNWQGLIQRARINAINKIDKLLGTSLEPLIESETILDPPGIELKTGSYMGSLYGSSSNSKFSAFLRPPNFTAYIKGLYCCGGTVHPGGGIPLCLKSAKIVAGIVEKDRHKQAHRHH